MQLKHGKVSRITTKPQKPSLFAINDFRQKSAQSAWVDSNNLSRAYGRNLCRLYLCPLEKCRWSIRYCVITCISVWQAMRSIVSCVRQSVRFSVGTFFTFGWLPYWMQSKRTTSLSSSRRLNVSARHISRQRLPGWGRERTARGPCGMHRLCELQCGVASCVVLAPDIDRANAIYHNNNRIKRLATRRRRRCEHLSLSCVNSRSPSALRHHSQSVYRCRSSPYRPSKDLNFISQKVAFITELHNAYTTLPCQLEGWL